MASEKVQSESMALANNHLAVHLHRLLAKEKGNVFFSPFSISTAMAMLLCGSKKQTEAEMRKVLGYDHAGIATQDIPTVMKQFTSSLLAHQGSYILKSANSVLTHKGFSVNKDYKLIVHTFFQALLLEVDFARNSMDVVRQINDWVKKKTNNMISHLLDTLHPDTVVVLLNAVYFKGTWLRRFNMFSTRPRKFFNYGNEEKFKLVDMMQMQEVFSFAENDSFKALKLPYVGENIAMLILLPHRMNGLDAVESTLTPSFIHDLSKSMCMEEVDVSLPRFKFERSTSLVPVMKQLGIERLFGRFDAELEGISDSEELFVSDIVHKAVIEVNEEGSEAAAVTEVMVDTAFCTPDLDFTVDHPFIFVVYETRNGMIIFMGRVEEL